MAATTPAKKPRRFKLQLAQMREQALEARDMADGVECPLSAGTFEVKEVDPKTGEETVTEVIEVADGETIFLPSKWLMDDDQQEAYDRILRDEDLDHEEFTDDAGNKGQRLKFPLAIDGKPAPSAAYRIAEAVLGFREHKRLLAGGGHSNDLLLAWQLITPVEPDPTRTR